MEQAALPHHVKPMARPMPFARLLRVGHQAESFVPSPWVLEAERLGAAWELCLLVILAMCKGGRQQQAS